MTHYDFILGVQKYYGPYENDTVKKDVATYLKETYFESELDQFLKNLKMHYSRKWKIVPDITVIIETEKVYPVIKYLQGYRQIPEQEKKREIENPGDREDYSKELREKIEQFKQKQIEGMIDRRKMKRIKQEGEKK